MSSKATPRLSLPNRSAYSCAKCAIALPDRQSLKAHCASLWHNHNLSLACRGVAPLSKEIYEMYRAQHSQMEKERSEGAELRYECTTCAKVFGSKGTYDTHVLSAKHREAVKSTEANEGGPHVFRHNEERNDDHNDTDDDEDQWEEYFSSDEEDEEVQARIVTCFMCEDEAQDMEDNLRHLEDEHGFYVPFRDDLLNVEQLVIFLNRKVCVYNECLSCERKFRHATAVRRHMEHKGHITMRSPAYQPFYANTHFDDSHAELEGALTARLASGSMLYHRSLRPFFSQRLAPKEEPADDQDSDIEELEYEEDETAVAAASTAAALPLRKLNKARHRMQGSQQKQRLGVAVRANRMQHHFREQVTRAG